MTPPPFLNQLGLVMKSCPNNLANQPNIPMKIMAMGTCGIDLLRNFEANFWPNVSFNNIYCSRTIYYSNKNILTNKFH